MAQVESITIEAIVNSFEQVITRGSAILVGSIVYLALGSALELRAQSLVALRGATVETVSAAGRIENATILVEDGKIKAVGTDIAIPDRADIIDVRGKTIIPGIVDPYFVVDFPLGGAAPAEERTVEFGGRRFNIPDTTSAPAVFVRIADVFDARRGQWNSAVRSGITTANIVTSGYGQSVIGTPTPDQQNPESKSVGPAAASSAMVREPNGYLFAAVTNQPASLRVIRDGLAEPRAPGESTGRGAGAAPAGGAAPERGGRFGGRRGGTPGDGGPPANPGTNNSSPSTTPPANSTPVRNPVDDLWKSVRAGERPLVVNVNNAATLLYLLKETAKAPKAKLAVVASGAEVSQVLEQLSQKNLVFVLAPRIENQAGTQQRINPAQKLEQAKIPFAFSLSTAQSDYRATQNNPLFPVAMLVKNGLGRDVALRALTLEPAKILGLEQEVGTIEPGRRADFVIFDEDPFSATAEVEQVWSAGKPLSGN